MGEKVPFPTDFCSRKTTQNLAGVASLSTITISTKTYLKNKQHAGHCHWLKQNCIGQFVQYNVNLDELDRYLHNKKDLKM